MKFEWVGTLSDDQISKWLAKFELAVDFIRPVRADSESKSIATKQRPRREERLLIEGAMLHVSQIRD